MNKYKENISDIITLDATEEIVDIFLESLEKTDKTTGIIANKELIEYAMGEALAQDWINVRRVDIEVEDLEYMLLLMTMEIWLFSLSLNMQTSTSLLWKQFIFLWMEM